MILRTFRSVPGDLVVKHKKQDYLRCNVGVTLNVSTNTVSVIWESVLQVKRPNQQYQST